MSMSMYTGRLIIHVYVLYMYCTCTVHVHVPSRSVFSLAATGGARRLRGERREGDGRRKEGQKKDKYMYCTCKFTKSTVDV